MSEFSDTQFCLKIQMHSYEIFFVSTLLELVPSRVMLYVLMMIGYFWDSDTSINAMQEVHGGGSRPLAANDKTLRTLRQIWVSITLILPFLLQG